MEISLSIRKLIKGLYMGLVAQNIRTQNEATISGAQDSDLTPQELEALLRLIKKTTFVGEDVEMVYTLVVKLQKQYLQKTK